ncbi:MAG: hypothetical protein FWH53_04100 [Leptospirales bacterium]|nr:hypothetical protein [Leptospirales bacterium]
MKRMLVFISFLIFSTSAFAIDYSMGDSLSTLMQKNPNVKFNETDASKQHTGETGRTQYEVVEGTIATTRTTFTFDSKGRLEIVIMNKHGAALNVYEPLVKKYTEMYGNPTESLPPTTDLRQNVITAKSQWEHPKGSVILLLVIYLDGDKLPWIFLCEEYKF